MALVLRNSITSANCFWTLAKAVTEHNYNLSLGIYCSKEAIKIVKKFWLKNRVKNLEKNYIFRFLQNFTTEIDMSYCYTVKHWIIFFFNILTVQRKPLRYEIKIVKNLDLDYPKGKYVRNLTLCYYFCFCYIYIFSSLFAISGTYSYYTYKMQKVSF